jgi:AcrR family transcriptional regulator
MARSPDPLAPPQAPAPSRPESTAIVDALVAAALELGPDASVNAIAERAGVGVASLYRYFPSKASILAELARRAQHDAQTRIQEVLAANPTPRQALVACCEIAVRPPGLSPAMRRALNLNVPASWSHASARATTAALVAAVASWLAARTSIPPARLERSVAAAFAAARGLVLLAVTQPELAPADDELRAIMERVVLACLDLEEDLGPAP